MDTDSESSQSSKSDQSSGDLSQEEEESIGEKDSSSEKESLDEQLRKKRLRKRKVDAERSRRRRYRNWRRKRPFPAKYIPLRLRVPAKKAVTSSSGEDTQAADNAGLPMRLQEAIADSLRPVDSDLSEQLEQEQAESLGGQTQEEPGQDEDRQFSNNTGDDDTDDLNSIIESLDDSQLRDSPEEVPSPDDSWDWQEEEGGQARSGNSPGNVSSHVFDGDEEGGEEGEQYGEEDVGTQQLAEVFEGFSFVEQSTSDKDNNANMDQPSPSQVPRDAVEGYGGDDGAGEEWLHEDWTPHALEEEEHVEEEEAEGSGRETDIREGPEGPPPLLDDSIEQEIEAFLSQEGALPELYGDLEEEDTQADTAEEGDLDAEVDPAGAGPSTVRDMFHETAMTVASFLHGLRTKHNMSKEATKAVYTFFCKTYAQEVAEASAKGEMPAFKTMESWASKVLPRCQIRVKYRDEDGQVRIKDRLKTLPRKLSFEPERLLYTCAYTTIDELNEFYNVLHERAGNVSLVSSCFDLSSDGVKHNWLGTKMLHLVSICFEGCLSPVPLMAYEFKTTKEGPTMKEMFGPIVEDINRSCLSLRRVLVDGKEQNVCRGMTATNGKYGCAFCQASGLSKVYGKRTVYPRNAGCARPMTTALFHDLFENSPHLFLSKKAMDASEDERTGVKRRSPLLDVPGFDIVNDVCPDALHLFHLGVTRRIWLRMSKGTQAFHNADRRRRMLGFLDRLYSKTKVPSEIRHKSTKNINPPHMRGQSWQLIDMHVFIAYACSILGPQRLRICLLTYSFMVRLCYCDDHTFANVKARLDLDRLTDVFLDNLSSKDLFTPSILTWGVHQMEHILQYRESGGPVWEYSTYRFESMYSKATRCYVATTHNVPVQLLRNFYGYQLEHHRCYLRKRMTFTDDKSTSKKTNDSLVYHEGKFFQIFKIEGTVLSLRGVATSAVNTQRIVGLSLPWSMVGVRRYHGVNRSTPLMKVDQEDVKAKAILCGNIISAVYPEWIIT